MLGRSLGVLALGAASASAGDTTRPIVPVQSSSRKFRPGLDYWIVDSRSCPQVMGSDPWRFLRFHHLDANASPRVVAPDGLLAMAMHRPVVVVLHGNRYSDRDASDEVFQIAGSLADLDALPPDAVVVAFDWPSERVYHNEIRDLNEKGRRAAVAGFHMARFLSAFPVRSRICLMGHSHGGQATLVALHLLGGGAANSLDRDPFVTLPWLPDRHRLRAVLVASASDHNWLDPGGRLERALPMCEGLLNLPNRRDLALAFYPFGRRTDGHAALGRVGLLRRDVRRLGPLVNRIEEHDLRPFLGRLHVFAEAMTHPQIARWVAPYTFTPLS